MPTVKAVVLRLHDFYRRAVASWAQVGTEEWTRGLGYNETRGWRPWYVGPTTGASSVAGYVTEYDVPTEFTYLTVKAA
jgi:hypothetical protein